MRVVVTGGLGFVGYAVTKNLIAAGHEVAALTRSDRQKPRPDGATLLDIEDIRDPTSLRTTLAQFDADAICHLAALAQVRTSFDQPLDYFDVNVNGTINLLRAITTLNKPIPVVFGSTGSVYGSGATGKLSEDDPVRPDNPYAVSKYTAEQLLTYHARTGAISTTILRCLVVAGACDGVGDPDDTRILPKTLLVAAGQAPHVTMNGDGSAIREFTHVLDVAEAYRIAIETSTPGDNRLFNVGSNTAISMADLIAAVAKYTNREIPIHHQPPRPEPHTLTSDSSRIRTELGWASPNSTIPQIIGDAWHALRQR